MATGATTNILQPQRHLSYTFYNKHSTADTNTQFLCWPGAWSQTGNVQLDPPRELNKFNQDQGAVRFPCVLLTSVDYFTWRNLSVAILS